MTALYEAVFTSVHHLSTLYPTWLFGEAVNHTTKNMTHFTGLLDSVLAECVPPGQAPAPVQPNDYDWVRLRGDPEKRFSYECNFKWILPAGAQPTVPDSRFSGFGVHSNTQPSIPTSNNKS